MSLFLLKIIASAVYFGVGDGQDTSMPNYFISKWNDDWFLAYPINVCMKTGVTSYTWSKFVCVESGSDWILQQQTFSKSKANCDSENLETISNFTKGTNNTLMGYDFNCGSYDNFMRLDICIGIAKCGSSCSLGASVYTVQDICFYGGNGTSDEWRMDACNDSNAVSSYYYGDICQSTAGVNDTLTAISDSCDLYTTLAAGALGTFNVYAQMMNCAYNFSSVAPTVLPSNLPTIAPSQPSMIPTMTPSMPSMIPSMVPSDVNNGSKISLAYYSSLLLLLLLLWLH